MCWSMEDIQYLTAEIRRGKKEQTTGWKYIWSALLHRATISKSYTWTKKWKWLLIKVKHLYILNVARCPYVRLYVRNAGRGQLSSKRRHYENDVTMIIASLVADGTGRRYGEWQHAAMLWLCVQAVHKVEYNTAHQCLTWSHFSAFKVTINVVKTV